MTAALDVLAAGCDSRGPYLLTNYDVRRTGLLHCRGRFWYERGPLFFRTPDGALTFGLEFRPGFAPPGS